MLDQDKTKEQLIAELHNLEKLVEARTDELTALNNQLQHEIAQHKAIEENLKLSEGQLRSVIATAHDAIITTDHQGIITSWNTTTSRIYGYSAEEIVDKPVFKIIPNALLIRISIRRRKLLRQPRSLNQSEWQISQDAKRMALNFLLSFQYHSGSLLLAHVLQQ
jgi:PAS domain S-box-containing protein